MTKTNTKLLIETSKQSDESACAQIQKKWTALSPENFFDEVIVLKRGQLKKCPFDDRDLVVLLNDDLTPAFSLDLFLSQARTQEATLGFHFQKGQDSNELFFPDPLKRRVDLINASQKSRYADGLGYSSLFYGPYKAALRPLSQKFETCDYAYHAGVTQRSALKGALFLDRDGVIIEDGRYLFEPEKVVLKEGVVDLIKRARERGLFVFCLTNQSGVARGYFSVDQMKSCHQKIDQLLGLQGVAIDEWFYSPYHPEGSEAHFAQHSMTRKPLPGMLMAAAMKYSLCLEKSVMVGDNLSDQLDCPGLKVYLTPGHYSLEGAKCEVVQLDQIVL